MLWSRLQRSQAGSSGLVDGERSTSPQEFDWKGVRSQAQGDSIRAEEHLRLAGHVEINNDFNYHTGRNVCQAGAETAARREIECSSKEHLGTCNISSRSGKPCRSVAKPDTGPTSPILIQA